MSLGVKIYTSFGPKAPPKRFHVLDADINICSYRVVSKNRGKTPKMDGENNEKPIKMDDLGVPLFLETPI